MYQNRKLRTIVIWISYWISSKKRGKKIQSFSFFKKIAWPPKIAKIQSFEPNSKWGSCKNSMIGGSTAAGDYLKSLLWRKFKLQLQKGAGPIVLHQPTSGIGALFLISLSSSVDLMLQIFWFFSQIFSLNCSLWALMTGYTCLHDCCHSLDNLTHTRTCYIGFNVWLHL